MTSLYVLSDTNNKFGWLDEGHMKILNSYKQDLLKRSLFRSSLTMFFIIDDKFENISIIRNRSSDLVIPNYKDIRPLDILFRNDGNVKLFNEDGFEFSINAKDIF